MTTLTQHDLQFALRRCPKVLLRVLKTPEWAGKVFVGGGFLRSIVAGDPVNDVDVFVSTQADADKLARALVFEQMDLDIHKRVDEEAIQKRIYRTPNALTLFTFNPVIQIIHRWVFPTGPSVADSFDFTCCCAAFWWEGESESLTAIAEGRAAAHWESYCDKRFYPDVAAKRLIYRSPVRNEDAGGSLLRVLKYYQKGYRIPLDSLGAVIGRLMKGYNVLHKEWESGNLDEENVALTVTGLLREVDPLIDPAHVAHLPAETVKDLELPEAPEL